METKKYDSIEYIRQCIDNMVMGMEIDPGMMAYRISVCKELDKLEKSLRGKDRRIQRQSKLLTSKYDALAEKFESTNNEIARLREDRLRIRFTPTMCRNLIDAFGGEPTEDVGDVIVEWYEEEQTWIAYVEEYPNDGVLDLCRDYRIRAAVEGGER